MTSQRRICMILLCCMLGSILASWICVCACRYENKTNELWSICPFCSHRLPFYQMIPVLSWLKLKGKCAWCGSDIPVYTLISELAGAVGFMILAVLFDEKLLFGMMIASCALLYTSLCDLLHGLIPDRTHFVIALGSLFIVSSEQRFSQILFALSLLTVLFFISSLTQQIGMGDVKLIASLSLILSPFQILNMLCIASTAALAIALIQKNFNRKYSIRFAPYLSFAAFICLLYLA